MGQRTSPELRRLLHRMHREGATYAQLAEQFQISRECVRYWCRRQRDGYGVETVYPSRRSGGVLSETDPKVRYVILRLRLEHPRWGPHVICTKLSQRPSLCGLSLPSRAGVGRYLHQWKKFRRRPVRRRPRERPLPPTQVHQRWQMDFKVDIRLADGLRLSLYTVQDPVGEVCIGAQLYPVVAGKSVHLEKVIETLRICYAHWQTLPEEIQTDGESVLLGSGQDCFPTRFRLWLAGLGIRHLVIHRATQNAEVERRHRTIYDYVIAGNEHRSLEHIQNTLRTAVQEMAVELPSQAKGCAGQPPTQAHPDLCHPHQAYLPELERARFDLQRVFSYLAGLGWTRKVDKQKRIYLGGRHERYKVERGSPGQTVLVRFDPRDRCFYFSDPDHPEIELGRELARGLSVEHIVGMEPWPIGPGPQQLLLPLNFEAGVSC